MAKNLKKQTPSFIFHFHGNVGQNIAHVDKIEAHFDKDMNMQIINPEESAKVVPAITTTPPDSAIPASPRPNDYCGLIWWLESQNIDWRKTYSPSRTQAAEMLSKIVNWTIDPRTWGRAENRKL